MSDTKRDSFIFYRSFIDIVRDLEAEQAKEFILAVSDYALDAVEPNLTGILALLWKPVKPQLEANRRRYENGKKGGAPKGSRNNPNGRRGKNEETNQDLTVNEAPAPTISMYPTLNQVNAYIAENNLNIKGDTFYNYYEANGWCLKNGPIRSWQAVLNLWASRQQETEKTTNNGLGVDERIDENGNRTYGQSGVIVPLNASARPSTGHWWNITTNCWENIA